MTHAILILSIVSLLGAAPGRLVSDGVRQGGGVLKSGAMRVYHGVAEGPAPALRPLEAHVLAESDRVFRALGVPPPTVDPAMVSACRSAADTLHFASAETSVSEVVRASFEHAGVTDAMTFPFTLRTVGDAAPVADLDDLIEAHLADRGITHVGVGVATEPMEDGERLVTLVYTRRMVTLGPFPRSVKTGETALLWGSVPDDTGFPEILVATPDGDVSEPPVYLGERSTFWCPLAFDAGAGVYMLEVLAGDTYGPQVANLFPVYVGQPAPELPVIRLLRPDPPDLGASELEARLLDLVNRDRARYGRKPLRRHKTLVAAALEHSADMARRDYFGHRGPSDGRVADRLARRRLHPSLVAEAISIAPSTTQAQANLMRSPSHRRTLLDPRMTHIGVGVVIIGRGESRRLVITEELARLP